MSDTESHPNNIGFEFTEFWENFRFSQSRIVEAILSRARFLIGLVLLSGFVVFVTVLVMIEPVEQWQLLFTFLPEGYVILLTVMLAVGFFARWRGSIPKTFRWLIDTQRLGAKTEGENTGYLQYLRDYQRMLLIKRGWSTAVAVVLFPILVSLLVVFLDIYRSAQNLTSLIPSLILLATITFASIVWGWILGLIAWPMIVTGWYIKNLPKKFMINVQPSHPDKCGGLKALGDFCFSMVLPIITIGLGLAIIGLGDTVHILLGISFYDVSVSFARVSLITIILPAVAITFFLPLWGIHTSMVEYKETMENDYATKVTQLEQTLRTHAGRDGKLNEEAKIAKEKLDILQAIPSNKIGYPVWPFRPISTLIKLLSPQLLMTIAGRILNFFGEILNR